MLSNNLSVDELTWVYNKRKWINDTFNSWYLLMVDIDHFKAVNDKYWHDIWDLVLRTISRTLKTLIRDNDAIYRFWWEEFCIYLDETIPDNIKEIAERIRIKIENLKIKLPKKYKWFNWEEWYLTRTLSIWVAEFNNSRTKKETFKIADENLYKSKENWRNQVTYENWMFN